MAVTVAQLKQKQRLAGLRVGPSWRRLQVHHLHQQDRAERKTEIALGGGRVEGCRNAGAGEEEAEEGPASLPSL